MTFDQLQKFANSPELHVRQIALTREGARQILAEHEREIANLTTAPEPFDIPEERADEGKFAVRKFGDYAKARADEHVVFEQTGRRTTAALRESTESI